MVVVVLMKWTWSPEHDHRDDTDENGWNEELDTLTWPLLQAHIRQLAKLNFWLVKEDLSFSRRPTTFAWTIKWVSRDQKRSKKIKEGQRGSLLQQTSHYFCLDHQRSIKRSKEITEDERRSKKILQQMSHYFSLDQQVRFNKCISHKFFPWATIKTISSVRLTSRGHHETDTK